MREAMIALPIADNFGAPAAAAHDYLESQLLASFGGFSVATGSGVWRDGNQVYRDEFRAYTVASEPEPGGETDARVAMLAHNAAVLAGQLAVYWRDFNGVVHIDRLDGREVSHD